MVIAINNARSSYSELLQSYSYKSYVAKLQLQPYYDTTTAVLQYNYSCTTTQLQPYYVSYYDCTMANIPSYYGATTATLHRNYATLR